jgi:hypothetical protein
VLAAAYVMAVRRLKAHRFTIERDGVYFILRLDGEPLDAYFTRGDAEQAAQETAAERRPGVRLEFRPAGEVLEAHLIVSEAE